jgi:adenosylmethionine-8-amino-7-oxononanoate aminotransferase
VVETEAPVALDAATAAAIEAGVWLRPFRNLVYAMPPYVAGEEDLRAVARAMVAAVRAGGPASGHSP